MTLPPPQDPQQPWPAAPPPGQPGVVGQPGSAGPGGSPFGQPEPSPGQFPGWPPVGPPPGNSNLKWILAAVVAIVAIVAVTVIVLNKGSGSGPTSAGSGGGPAVTGGGTGSASPFASAGDTGPITIITDEPTCATFIPISNGVAAVEQNGWTQRDPSIPASAWTPEQRSQYQAVGAAIGNAADQYVPLAKQTPHRVVRELYEQMTAYGHAYADSIAHLTQRDDYLARTYNTSATVLVNICESITYGSAAARAGIADPSPTPSQVAPVGDPAKPQRFLTTAEPLCSNWQLITKNTDDNLSQWGAVDGNIPATQWTPDQRAVYDAAGQFMLKLSDGAEKLVKQQSASFELNDFLNFISVYFRAYAKVIPTYIAADNYLSSAGMYMVQTISGACEALGAWS